MERSGHDFSGVMELLRSRGLRMTPQRRAIVSEVMRTQGHIAPTQIARKVQGEMPGVNASTVYRTLATLEDIGVLSHSHLETGAEYHRTEEAEHVHLTCGNCGWRSSAPVPLIPLLLSDRPPERAPPGVTRMVAPPAISAAVRAL